MNTKHYSKIQIAFGLFATCIAAASQLFCPGRPEGSTCSYLDTPPCNTLSEACVWPTAITVGVIKKNCLKDAGYYYGGCNTDYAGSEEACTQDDLILTATHYRQCCDAAGQAVTNYVVWDEMVFVEGTFSWDSSPCTSAPPN